MKRIWANFTLCILLFGMALLYAEPANLGVPDLFNGIHNQYGTNWLNAATAGRGNTGVSVPDRIRVNVHNPAAYRAEDDHFSFDFMYKTAVDDFTEQYIKIENGVEVPFTSYPKAKYRSPFPLSYFGIGFSPIEQWNMGISYSQNRSIRYDAFRRVDNATGETLVREPTYREHQVMLTGNRKFGDFTIGGNLIFLIPTFTEYRNDGDTTELSFSHNLFRPQLGLLYESPWCNVGVSYLPKVSQKVGTEYLEVNAVYQSNVKAGVSMDFAYDIKALVDIEYNSYSETSDYLDDQLIWKVGVEKTIGKLDYRIGFMYVPSVFEGKYLVKEYSEHFEGISTPSYVLPVNIPDIGKFQNTDMSLLTLGCTINNLFEKDLRLHLAAVCDISGNVGMFQVMAGVDLDFSVFDKSRR